METSCLENGMPGPNQRQVVTSERRELEPAAKQVRFAGRNTSPGTARGGGEPAAADVTDNTSNTSNTSNSDIAKQIGPQLKILPLNDQIRELQTIIRDK